MKGYIEEREYIHYMYTRMDMFLCMFVCYILEGLIYTASV